MNATLKELNRNCKLTLRVICSEQKDNCTNLIRMTNTMLYCYPDGMETYQITGLKMRDAFIYFLDSFEHIYFNVNNYITSDRNLRQVNRSLYWIKVDYEKFKDLPEIDEVIEHCHRFYHTIFNYGLLAVEAYEALAKLMKAEEKINKAINEVKTPI